MTDPMKTHPPEVARLIEAAEAVQVWLIVAAHDRGKDSSIHKPMAAFAAALAAIKEMRDAK